MRYKVFLVEDEIVTREGIRDNVDWAGAGFEFCGEASDGEMALPLLEETQPDVLITDIKMPFMDGLQLSKIVREHMPWIKIIILSGHNEFEYAQSAVKLGVTEYLLKPISAKDLLRVLEGLFVTLDREYQEREKLKNLQSKIQDNLTLSREKFLLKLVMGGVSSAEAIEQSQQYGLDIVARYYLVVLIRIEFCEDSQILDYERYQRVEQTVSQFARDNPDVLLTQKDLEELVLLLKSDNSDQLVQEGSFLIELIKREVEKQIPCNLIIEMGTPQNRLSDIHHSFAEALVKSKATPPKPMDGHINSAPIDLVGMDHQAIQNYLKFGAIQDFDSFFSVSIRPLAEIALQSSLLKHYLFVDVILTAAQFVSDLGGQPDQVIANVHEIEEKLQHANSLGEIQNEIGQIFFAALDYRNSQANRERVLMLQQAKSYLDQHLDNPDLHMNKVAQKFNLSPGHFSTIFHQEMGETFRGYLGRIRINRAKELLCTTSLACSEIAYQSGFSDPHYFSFVFKKKTGLTPQQFRAQFEDYRKVE